MADKRNSINAICHYDAINIREPIYRSLDFKMSFAQQLNNISFIYLHPNPRHKNL